MRCMDARKLAASPSIRDRFFADHRRLETLLEQLLSAFEANDREDMSRLWNDFESGLLAHLEAEETYLIPALERVAESEAHALLQEHERIRKRLTELGVSLDLHTLRFETARVFVDELRAHAATEDRLLYRWAEQNIDLPRRASVLDALSTLLRARAARRRS